MTDYIDREAAINEAEKYGLSDGSVIGRHSGIADCIASEISRIPAADVAPVVHGKWVDNGIPGSMLSMCSVCGIKHGACTFNYCPNCGADMREVPNDD